MYKVFLSLGSNLGDREKLLEEACKQLSRFIHNAKISSVIETEPMYCFDQPSFLNQVLCGITTEDPFLLWRRTWEIQKTLGRIEPKTRYGPRNIDIDLLDYQGTHMTSDRLTLPHPRLHERLFVLEPLQELDPLWVHPTQSQHISQLIKNLKED